jgi:hypothetical protein
VKWKKIDRLPSAGVFKIEFQLSGRVHLYGFGSRAPVRVGRSSNTEHDRAAQPNDPLKTHVASLNGFSESVKEPRR